jgi:3-methyladenine DNA glycosylase AlkD
MISPKQLAAQTLRELKAAGDPRVAAQLRVYFKSDEEVRFFGVNTPTTRSIAKALSQQVRGQWRLDDAIAFCDRLIREREIEAKAAGIFVLADFKKSYEKTMLRTIEEWLAGNHCADWATTDNLCTSVMTPLIRAFPELSAKLKGWTTRRNLWLRRASAVSLIHAARRGQHLDEVFEIAERLLPCPEDLIHKACGWLLREAGKTDAKRLERFLLAHGPRIPRTTLRYAIERFPPARRKALLAKTKADN